MSEGNSWVSRPVAAPMPVESASVEPVAAPTGPTAPQLGVPAPSAADRLPFVQTGRWAPVWIVGVHGGSGESTLAALLPGAMPSGHAWPQHPGASVRVVLTARTSMQGLSAAQKAAQQWAAGIVPGVELIGLVAMADAPGRLPRALRDHLQVVSGGFPRTWSVPWIESWRTSELVDSSAVPREVRRVVDELTALANNQQKG